MIRKWITPLFSRFFKIHPLYLKDKCSSKWVWKSWILKNDREHLSLPPPKLKHFMKVIYFFICNFSNVFNLFCKPYIHLGHTYYSVTWNTRQQWNLTCPIFVNHSKRHGSHSIKHYSFSRLPVWTVLILS